MAVLSPFLLLACILSTINTVYGNSQFKETFKSLHTRQSHGEPWPLPFYIQTETTQYALNPLKFKFLSSSKACDILTNAFYRYRFLTFPSIRRSKGKNDQVLLFVSNVNDQLAEIVSLEVVITTGCRNDDYPTLESNELYDLRIAEGKASLRAESVWGALRGLETFSQLVHRNEDGGYVVNSTEVYDKPRFAFRATMLDTSRHYVKLDVIKQNLDAMAYNKFNVFHWHIVDDPSFPYESYTFPDLSQKGAFTHAHVYTQTAVKEVIEYARLRGIMVIPEFDTPGHSQSWGPGQMDLLTPCYSGEQPNNLYGPINPTLNSSYTFLAKLFEEIAAVFPNEYIHIGGDEVSFACWKSNPAISEFMKTHGFGTDYAKLEEYYIQKLLKIVYSKKRSSIVWQEVIDNKAKVQADTVVDIWKSAGYQAELTRVTGLGYKTVLSACWYLNIISYGIDWPKFYNCDPQVFSGTAAQKKLVIGGETCMWGEFVDSTNLISRFWPRASAVAERLWSQQTVTDVNAAAPRLGEQRCRMLRRGLNVEPINGPGFCPDGA